MGNPWDEAPVASQTASNPWDAAPVAAAAPPASIGREVAIANRGLTSGLVGPVVGGAIGALGGPEMVPVGAALGGLAFPQKKVQDLLTKMGIPEPASTAERALEAASNAVSSAGAGIASGASMATNAATPMLRSVGTALSQQPALQMATAPLAAGANQAVTEKTGSPVLGFLSALMVGGAPAMVMGGAGETAVRQDIQDQARQHYQTMENSGLNISPDSVKAWVESLPDKIKGWGKFAPDNAPTTARLMNTVQKVADSGEPVSIADLDQLHHVLGGSHSIANTDFDNASLYQMKSALNDYVKNLKPDDLTGTLKPGEEGGPANYYDWRTANADKIAEATGALDQARTLWRANSKMRDIEQITDTAANEEDRDLYLRQQFRRIKRNPDQFANYTPEEQDAIVKISNQGVLGQIGRAAPHLTPAGMVKGAIIHGPVAAVTGPVGAGLTAAGTYGAFKAAQALRRARIQGLQNTIAGVDNPSVLGNTALQTAPLIAARAYGSNPLGIGASRAQSIYAPQFIPPDNADDEYAARNP